MQTINWAKSGLDSEIEYSRALKGKPVVYSKFIHMHNPFVPWSGDFNRAVGVKLSGFRSFEGVVSQVEGIHRAKNLERPNRYDIYPPALNEVQWRNDLLRSGYNLETAIFFQAPTLGMPTPAETLPPDYVLTIPSEPDYLAWFCRLAQARGFYNESWFQSIRPLQLSFIRIFKPYWLLREGELVGWVYCANLGAYARLFEVEISPPFRGQGLGKLLLRAIRMEGHRLGTQFILLQAGERLRPFYEKAGFKECAANSIIWLRA